MFSSSPRRALTVFFLSLVGSTGCGSSGASVSLGSGTGGKAGSGSFSSSEGSSGTSGSGGGGPATALEATAIAVGATHSCALLVSGEVACWGDGSSGQLGDGVAMAGYSRATPAKVPGLTGVKAIRAGGDTTCAILADHVVCWGDGTYGQLGNGNASSGYFESTPVKVLGLSSVKSLSISDTGACAIAADGSALCWGRNTAGGWLGFTSSECGPYPTSTTAVEQPCEKVPRAVPGVSSAVAIATSSDHCCATLKGGSVSCWGADTYGQLGDGFSGVSPHDPSPVAVDGVSTAARLAVGTSFTCAVMGEGEATSCWGDNSYGQLGIGTAALDSNQATPVSLGLEHVIDLDAAASATCAVLAGGAVRCWGEASGLFSPDTTAPTDAPLAVPGVTGAVSVRTSGSHACALREDRSVQCWGRDDVGQLGDGQQSLGAYVPTAVLAP